jgi:hypothetical protein
MTHILYTGTKPLKKPKRKPGWQETQRQYQEWLEKHKPTALTAKPFRQVSTIVIDPERLVRPPSQGTGVGTAGKAYVDPRVQYKDDPKLAERELAARQRKFTVAPVYNKGPDQYVSEDVLNDMKAGLLRRR